MKWRIINFVETVKHKAWVVWYIVKACTALMKRAASHDMTKFSRLEAPYFEKALPKLRGLEYGAPEYMEAIKSLGPALTHHYTYNRHHPEFYCMHASINEMSPLDLIEMLCDWKAAGRRHATGNMLKSLEINKDRFQMSQLLYYALCRDAGEINLT